MKSVLLLPTLLFLLLPWNSCAQYKPYTIYPVFQFPADRIPRVDGNTDDWVMVPESYVVGTDQLWDDSGKHKGIDRSTLDVRVKTGWVKGMNRLYFLYEAYDDYWDFARPDLHNDTYEIVIDADLSGGPLIDQEHEAVWSPDAVGISRSKLDPRIDIRESHFAMHGVHAQNYHIFTPAEGKEWALAWGVQPWIKDLPMANASCSYNFRPGEPGKLVLEFWITPFDYAGNEGPCRAVESVLTENKLIGLSWAVIDYDDVTAPGNNGFWNLSPHHTMYGNASQLCLFRLMPLEEQFRKPIQAFWTHQVIDMNRRLVAFTDQSTGVITSWKWEFGDGQSSDEQHPMHQYTRPGDYVVTLTVEGPAGKARWSKVWDVAVK